MIFSNRLSFHHLQILQNATALPAYIYRETNNRASANYARHAISKQYWLKKKRQIQARLTKTTQHNVNKQNAVTQRTNQEFIPAPFPEQRTPVVIDQQVRHKSTAQAPPQPVHNGAPRITQTSKPSQNGNRTNSQKPPAHKTQKFVWKPGRGAVEKIDKYSGEIFHLVEST